MFIDRETRQELNELSKKVFGSASKWQKILSKGTMELQVKTVTETVPGENGQPDTKKEFKVVALNEHGQKIFKTRYYTVDEVRQIMVNAIAHQAAQEALQKAEEERKELEQRIQDEAAGGTGI